MKKVSKLVKRGWWKAMTHQGTLSLILTLDDFLVSGPYMVSDISEISISDPNVFFIKPPISKYSESTSDISDNFTVSTYFILRPYIRGILYGLNPLYQISLYVPCKDPIKIQLYREIISRIDIGGQFFQDRIYWNLESLQNDIMDPRLACLIYAGNMCLNNEWLSKISIESRPFTATIESDLTKSENLFDLVEIRGFLEDVHQRYFSLLSESKKIFFADTIRCHVNDQNRRNSGQSDTTTTSGFYSTTTEYLKHNIVRPFSSDNHKVNIKDNKNKKDFKIFRAADVSPLLSSNLNTNTLLEEYEDIIQEQYEINYEINRNTQLKISFAKLLCRWNTITQRKSDLLRILINQNDKEYIRQRLKHINDMFSFKKSHSENDLFGSVNSSKSIQSSESSVDIVVSESLVDSEENLKNIVPFTKWYTKS